MKHLENLVNLYQICEIPLFQDGTIQHADEITSQRRNQFLGQDTSQPENKFRPEQCFWTADFPLYHVEDDEVVLYLARGKDSLIFKKENLETAMKELKETHNYIPEKKEAETVIKQETTLKVRLSQLRLIKNQVFSQLIFGTAHYDKLNAAERALAERVYGQGQEFVENMEMLTRASRGKVFINVLNPGYVKAHAKKNGFLARGSALEGLAWGSGFWADEDFRDRDFWIRGVPLNKEIVKRYGIDYDTLLLEAEAREQEILRALKRGL